MAEPRRRSPGSWLLLLARLPLLLAHVSIGVALVLMTFLPVLRDLRFGGLPLRYKSHRLWSRCMIRIFGVRLKISGELPDGPWLAVANHISWLDIVLLHALWPMSLVAKAEIRSWPIIGLLAGVAGTVFIQRGSEASRRRVNRRMAALLKRGERVGIFPEGGISPRAGVGRFHARLLAPAVRAGVPVVPVAIRYYRNGDLHDVMVFGRGESFVGNLLRLLAQPASEGQIMVGEPLVPGEAGRSGLARQAHETVKAFYES
jgi:1-acyl-sn-glycerol-3-phosphate acyltransferase